MKTFIALLLFCSVSYAKPTEDIFVQAELTYKKGEKTIVSKDAKILSGQPYWSAFTRPTEGVFLVGKINKADKKKITFDFLVVNANDEKGVACFGVLEASYNKMNTKELCEGFTAMIAPSSGKEPIIFRSEEKPAK